MKSLLVYFIISIFVFKSNGENYQKNLDSSWFYINHGNQVRAIKLLSNQLQKLNKNLNNQTIFNIYKMLGKAYYDIGDPSEASLYFIKGLNLAKEINDSTEIGNFYILLSGSNIHNLGSLCLGYLNKAEMIFKKLKNQERLNMINYRRGLCYAYGSKHDSTLYYYNKLIPIYESCGADSMLTSIYCSLGVTYNNLKDFSKCVECCKKSIKLCEKIGDNRNISLNYANLADYFLQIKSYDSSTYYSFKTIEVANKINYLRSKIVAYQTLVEVNKRRNNYKLAMTYYEKLVSVADSFQHLGKDVSSLTIQLKSDFKEKETQLKYTHLLEVKESENRFSKLRVLSITIGGVVILILLFTIILYNRFKLIKNQNNLIEIQKQSLEQKNLLIELKQEEIIASITYAKRLQEAILPPIEFVNANLKNNFIYYQPKDIVAGDFYWAEKVGDKFFIAAADSTGHGVPGAMVSVVCSNALNRTIKEFKLTETGKILDKTRDLVLETFEKSEKDVKDGMDISLLCIDSETKKIFWSGANNPLWYIEDNKLHEIKADKQPIGKVDNPKPFTTHQINHKENTTFYLFTDGFADQFGGPNGKKFKYKQFSDLLIKHNNLSAEQKANIINKTFLDWKGDLEQVDDVCVIGIKL